MTVLNTGSNKKFAAGWETVFRQGRAAATTKGEETMAKKKTAKKTASKAPAAKKAAKKTAAKPAAAMKKAAGAKPKKGAKRSIRPATKVAPPMSGGRSMSNKPVTEQLTNAAKAVGSMIADAAATVRDSLMGGKKKK